jgi:hypothetical protein
VGATTSFYYIPYQPDIRAAIRGYQQELFDTGGYYLPPSTTGEPDPTTLDELQRDDDIRDAGGTHSLLDITTVHTEEHPELLDTSSVPDCVMPLPDAMLVAEFPNRQPTREQVTAIIEHDYAHPWWRFRRWRGLYVVSYEQGQPTCIVA